MLAQVTACVALVILVTAQDSCGGATDAGTTGGTGSTILSQGDAEAFLATENGSSSVRCLVSNDSERETSYTCRDDDNGVCYLVWLTKADATMHSQEIAACTP